MYASNNRKLRHRPAILRPKTSASRQFFLLDRQNIVIFTFRFWTVILRQTGKFITMITWKICKYLSSWVTNAVSWRRIENSHKTMRIFSMFSLNANLFGTRHCICVGERDGKFLRQVLIIMEHIRNWISSSETSWFQGQVHAYIFF